MKANIESIKRTERVCLFSDKSNNSYETDYNKLQKLQYTTNKQYF